MLYHREMGLKNSGQRFVSAFSKDKQRREIEGDNCRLRHRLQSNKSTNKQGNVPNIVCAKLWWLSLSKPPLGFLALLLSVRFNKLIEHLWAFRCFDKLSNHKLNTRLNSVGAFAISAHTLKQWRFFTSHYFGLF